MYTVKLNSDTFRGATTTIIISKNNTTDQKTALFDGVCCAMHT
jgi:hypothetical protein